MMRVARRYAKDGSSTRGAMTKYSEIPAARTGSGSQILKSMFEQILLTEANKKQIKKQKKLKKSP